MSGNEFSVKMTEDATRSLESFGIDYELFDGVLGKNGINVLKSYGVKPSAYVPVETWTSGTIGCLASHYLLWQECANQEEPFLILEQDAVVIRDPREILDLIENVCHMDAYLPFESENNLDHFSVYNKNLEIYKPGVKKYPTNVFYSGKSSEVTGNVFRGAYAYIITPQGAKLVLKFIEKYGAFPADACLCQRACDRQRANSTYVRLNPFFENLNIQRSFSSRNPKLDI